jgi:hypothetical protein
MVCYYLGATADGRAAVHILLVTAEEVHMAIGVDSEFPAGVVEMTEAGATVRLHQAALHVGAARKAVVADPQGGASVGSEGARLLASAWTTYFGGDLAPRLAKLRESGKDHLLVVPHGPLHFFPFHLVETGDGPLAERWIVTYLPNLALLDRAQAPPPDADGGRVPFGAIGCDFAKSDPHGCGSLPDAQAEARGLARMFGTKAVVGDDATESALVAALTGSRMVHVATHGTLHVHAPAFQRVFLMPGGASRRKTGDVSDGVLNAYEVLGLPLRGLDLVTLSACETALGRFDEGDNLRGLAANLFVAGASTIVGALWEVETEAARRFFTAFYSRLKRDGSRLDAFAHAQKVTRGDFPEYRDWGAFYLMGAWGGVPLVPQSRRRAAGKGAAARSRPRRE